MMNRWNSGPQRPLPIPRSRASQTVPRQPQQWGRGPAAGIPQSVTPMEGFSGPPSTNQPPAWNMADGGIVDQNGPDVTNSRSGVMGDQTNPITSKISNALKVVDSVLAYGRKLNGLSGSETEGGQSAQTEGGIPTPEDDSVQSFADGGAVEEDDNPANDPLVPTQEAPTEGVPENETTGSVATPETPVTGETPVEPAAREQGPLEQAGVLPHQLAQRGIKSLVGYLQGSGGDTNVAQQYEQKVDPQQALDADTRKLLAIQAAAEGRGEDEAWKVAQAQRQIFNHMRAFATAAVTGINGKQADLAAAAKSATDAYSNIPDGRQVSFVPNNAGGVTATVTPLGSNESQAFNLSAQQFTQLLRGPEGHFDVLKDVGVEKVLRDLSQRAAPTQAPGTQPGAQRTQPGFQPYKQYTPQERQQAAVPAPETPTGNRFSPNERAQYDRQLELRSREMFPFASQNQQRLAWLNQMEQAQAERTSKEAQAVGVQKGKLDVARETSGSRERVADLNVGARDRRTEAYERINNHKIDTLDANTKATLMQKAQQHADLLRQRGDTAKLQAFTKMMGSYTANQLTLDADKMERDTGFSIANALSGVSPNAAAPQAPTQVPNAPQAPRAPQAQPPGAPAPGMKWQQNKSTGQYRQVPIQ